MDAQAPLPEPPGHAGFRWGPVLLVVAVLALYFVMTRPQPPLEGWHTDYEAALVEAGSSSRLVLVAFSLPGCAPCKAMERTVLNMGEVRSALERFVPVRVDLSQRLDVANRFAVFAAPTYIIIDAEGQLLGKREGPQTVEGFVAFLQEASTNPRRDTAPTEGRPTGGP